MRSHPERFVQVGEMPDFWLRICKFPERLLALDYDGVLAPFKVDPMQAYPLPEIRDALSELKSIPGSNVAIISGRPVCEIMALLGISGIALIGCHGHESVDVEGNITVLSPTPKQLEGLEKAVEAATRHGVIGRVEKKIGSIAFHTRGAPKRLADTIEAQVFIDWSQLAPFELRCRKFKGGVEIYCIGRNKAGALRDLLAELPKNTLPVYLGDDATDEDVFRMFQDEDGIGIKIGPPSDATAAKGFLPNCEAVSAFLDSWLSFITMERSQVKNGDQKTCSRFEPTAHSSEREQ